eukprot:gene11661-4898_t
MFSFTVFGASLALHYLTNQQNNSKNKSKFLVSHETKEVFTQNSKIFKNILQELYTDKIVEKCLVIHPTFKKNIFFIKGYCEIQKGKIIKETTFQPLKENINYCSNYVLGPNENFIRIDFQSTIVSEKEKETDNEILNSTRIESGHKLLAPDLKYIECAGEFRFKVNEVTNDGTFIEILSINLQTSVYDYPDLVVLENLERLGIEKSMYKTNSWEEKGRKKKNKNFLI